MGQSNLEVRAHAKNKGALVGGMVATGVGGGLAFMGGFLALAGGLSERSGLLVAGSMTAGIGLLAVGPGVYLIATSGSRTELRADGVPTPPVARSGGWAPGLSVARAF